MEDEFFCRRLRVISQVIIDGLKSFFYFELVPYVICLYKSSYLGRLRRC